MNEPFLYAGAIRFPPPVYQLRTRKEVSTRDAVNARMFEEWQTDAPSLLNNRHDTRSPAVLDMNPINSRTKDNNYRQSQPYLTGGSQTLGTTAEKGANPYFDRYDPKFDSRNAIRELRSAVYEDKPPDRGVDEAKKLMQRIGTNRWNEKTDVLVSMRPLMNDMKMDYRSINQTAPQQPYRASA